MDSFEKTSSREPILRSPPRIALLPGSPPPRDAASYAGATHLLLPDLLQVGGDAGVLSSPKAAWQAIAAAAVALTGGRVAPPLPLLIDLALDCVAVDGDAARDRPDLFEPPDRGQVLDPRILHTPHLARPVLHDEAGARRLGTWWGEAIASWAEAGASGVRLRGLANLPRGTLAPLLAALRSAAAAAIVIADTADVAWEEIATLQGCGLDAVTCSLAWWNWQDRWFGDELALLRPVAPAVAPLPPDQVPPGPALERALGYCLGSGLGWIAEPGAEARTAAGVAGRIAAGAPGRRLTSPGEPVQAMLRADSGDARRAGDARWSDKAVILLVNAAIDRPAGIDPAAFLPGVGGAFAPFAAEDGSTLLPGRRVTLGAGESRVFEAAALAAPPHPALDAAAAVAAAASARLAIEAVTPAVDGGLFPVKRIAGELVEVEADVIGDGHDILSAALQWQAPGGSDWQETRMRLLGNDRWTASFPLAVRGLHRYRVVAWRDHFATYQHELGAKAGAGVPIALELIEGRAMVRAASTRPGAAAAALVEALGRIDAAAQVSKTAGAGDEASQRDLLLAPGLADLMAVADDRPHLVASAAIPVDAERTGAGFASWYEVFPRSMSDDPHRHGTFRDVERHLPRIRDMGFDVLYFPPIHPIGRVNRKGPNNTLTPGPDDVGSPYAVGSEEGGHDAIHPALGSLAEFLHLRHAAEAHGLELAVDFAIQCAPDHPWLREHRDWFAWRPDGSIRYAENPPKKYQDIVNVDFYADGAVPDLWIGLANVVLYWCEQGIRLFRVDNPHTKPFAFWQWMIGEVRARYPDAVFLAEAFTRPKVMNRLAKVGFGQSYTYFTWRNSKAELTEYLTQLSQQAPRDYFRPHFFVNTPDINPVFLQHSGRTGFLIRAALAATMSGLWGVYCGFELCEGAALPGREEYLDSEKYQIRTWDWQRPGNIVGEITRLNRIRAENPALRSHLSIAFLPAANDAVLFYEKATRDRSDCVFCFVSLDPHNTQQASVELPLWKWGLPDQATLQLEDLIGGDRFQLTGKFHTITLTPQQPYLLWRAQPAS
ncbi:alpha-1,4-glucan--maltose-1-phosphate maltosyltransferase [Lichenicoccus sp.]|uniref:alpha-1,4-glucan--maltose-1-phosphate maltosyltransferase n=1 Tax=Lichenicoccus sp. TaxID=2781899 RepID=UPI003D098FC6